MVSSVIVFAVSAVTVKPAPESALQPSAVRPSNGFGETMCDFHGENPLVRDGCLVTIYPWMWATKMMACASTGCKPETEIAREYHAQSSAYNASSFGQAFPYKQCSNNPKVQQVGMIWGPDYDSPVLPAPTKSHVYYVICPRSSTGEQSGIFDMLSNRTDSDSVREQGQGGVTICRSGEYSADDCKVDMRG